MKKVFIFLLGIIMGMFFIGIVRAEWVRITLAEKTKIDQGNLFVYYDNHQKVDCYVVVTEWAYYGGTSVAIDCIKTEEK